MFELADNKFAFVNLDFLVVKPWQTESHTRHALQSFLPLKALMGGGSEGALKSGIWLTDISNSSHVYF